MKTNRYRRVQIKNSDYGISLTLKDEIKADQNGHYSIYTVQENNTQVVKLMNLSDEFVYQQFQQEVLAWSRMREEKPNFQVKQTKDGKYDQFPNVVDTKAAFRAIIKDLEFGVLVMEHCPKGSLDSICDRLPPYALKEIQIMRIIRDILQGVQYLHMRQNPLIHRNLTMQNIMLGEDNNYKIINFSNVTTHRYYSISNDEYSSLESEIKKHTSEGYRAPEQIHLYSGYPINEKADIFAVGVILYILCFHAKPFDSVITTLNAQIEIPDFPKYSPNVNIALQKMLTRDPNQRPSSMELLQFVLQAWPDLKILQTKTGLLDTDIFKQAAEKEVKPTMINKFKKMITLKLQNKRTKGWILAALEENEKGPKQKYMRLLIIKAWQKTDKIEKFYDQFNIFLTPQNVQNTIIALKSLILLHNYIKKGPPEALSTVSKKVSAVNVLKKVIETWQNIDPSDDSKDKKRSLFTTKLINMYSQRLKEKMNLCVSYCSLIEGNFSLKPFFDNMNKNFKPLTHKLIEDLLKYMASLISFSQEILSQNQLMEIQISLMIQLVDEMYCLLSAQTHLLTAFITSTNYLSKNIDRGKLFAKVKDFKINFARNFEAAKQFFRKCQNALSQSSQKDFIPTIDSKVVEYINNLPCMQDLQNEFNLFEFLNYKKSIYGIKLPLSYGATIQTNNHSEEMKREMENVTKKPPPGQKLIVQLDDQKTTSNSNSNSQDTKEKNYDFQKQFKKKNQLIRGEKNLLSDQDNDDYNIDEQQEVQGISDFTPTYKNKSPEQRIIQNHLVDTAQMMQMKQNQMSQSQGQFLANNQIENAGIKRVQSGRPAPTTANTMKKNFVQNNKKQINNKQGDYLMDDEDEFDEENPNLNNNNSDSDEVEDSVTINDNNQNYNDILDQDDEQENFQLEFTHQSLNKQQYSQGEMNYEKMPSNMDKFKNMNFIDYNDMNNNQNQNNFQHSNSMSVSNTNMMNNNQMNQQNNNNVFQDEFHDFNNFQNFGLKHSQSNILNVNNNTTNNSFTNNKQTASNFNDFNFNFDNSTSAFVNNNNIANNNNNFNNANYGNQLIPNPNKKTNQNSTTNNQNNNSMGFNAPNTAGRNNNSASKSMGNNFQDFNQYNNNNNAGHFQQPPNSQQSSAQKSNQNQYDFSFQNPNANSQQQKQQNKIQIKFELKENKGSQMNSPQQFPPSGHQPHSQSLHHGPTGMLQQFQQKPQQSNFNNFQLPNHANNRPGSQSAPKSPNNYFEDFNFVNQSNAFINNNNNTGNNYFNQGFNQSQQQQNMYGMNQQQMNAQQQQQQNKQQVNNFFNQQQQLQNQKAQQQQQYNQKVSQSNISNAEEFDASEMVENNKAIEFTNAASIKRNDLNQLNQISTQINATNNQVNNSNLNNNNNQVLQSVNSTFSSNNENLIELKNFIVNRVKHDPKQLIVDFNSITFGKKIGSGHSGKVFSGVFNNVEVAIKEMEVNMLNERNQKEFQREIETLVKISPQINLVSLIGVAQKKDNFYIITELCHGGTIFDLLHRKHTTPLPWLHRVKMCKDIATGMIYLHQLEPPIIHRDLKSLNLLLDIPYQEDIYDYHVKIADFGLARTESKDEMTQVLGTFHWMAPEVFDNKQYTIKADVYSYAIVLWEFISRKTPYQKMSTVDIMKNVCEGKRPTLEFIPNDCPPMLIDLMKDCWEQDPNKRPDFKEVLERLDYIENDLSQMRNKSASRPSPPAVTTINKQVPQQPPKPQGQYNPPMQQYQNQQQPLRQSINYQQQQQLQQQQPNQFGGYMQQNYQQQQNIQVFKQ